VTIFANCVALGVYTPYPESDSNELNAALVSLSQSFIHNVLVDPNNNLQRGRTNFLPLPSAVSTTSVFSYLFNLVSSFCYCILWMVRWFRSYA